MSNVRTGEKLYSRYLPIVGICISLTAGFLIPSLKPFIFLLLVATAGVILSSTKGTIVGVTITFLASGSLIFLVSTVSFFLNFPLTVVADVTFLFVGLAAAVSVYVAPAKVQYTGSKLRIFSLAIGPSIVLLTALFGRLGEAFPVMSWVMRGDSANNLVFAWKVFGDNGVDLTYRENPVPLPADLIAFFSALQNPEGRSQFVLASLTGLALVWTSLIAITSLIFALAVDQVVSSSDKGSRFANTLLVIFASLIPLSWLFSGYLLESGFFGAQIAVLILLSAWVLAICSSRVWLVALGLYGATLLTLVTWSPLTLATGALLALFILRNWKKLLLSWKRVFIQLFLIVIILFIALTATLPSFSERSDVLASAVGGVHPFDHLVAPILFTLECGLIAILYIRGNKMFAIYSAAFLGSIFSGLLFLLALRRGEESPWAYYQLKYEWFFLLMLISVGLVLIAKLISPIPSSSWREKLGWSLSSLAVISLLVVLPGGNTRQAVLGNFPAQTLVMETGRENPDGVFESFWEAFNRDYPTILWGSENPDEFFVDFWLLQQHSDDILDPLRGLAYSQDLKDMNQLCQISTQLGHNTHVLTKDPAVEAKFRATCPENDSTVFVLQ